jgi:hypothetical protein
VGGRELRWYGDILGGTYGEQRVLQTVSLIRDTCEGVGQREGCCEECATAGNGVWENCRERSRILQGVAYAERSLAGGCSMFWVGRSVVCGEKFWWRM